MIISSTIKYIVLPIFIFLTIPIVSATTPNQVYQSASNLASNIKEIRLNQNITNEARKPDVQIAKTPLHAYTKALEVFEKVIRFKKLKNWPTDNLPVLPSKKVSPADVLILVKNIASELDDINKELAIKFNGNAKLPVDKTPSDVYEKLWQSSYLLDDLVGEISPNFVYRNTIRIENALIVIAKKLNKSTQISDITLPKNKKPIDANIDGFKILYQLVELERELKLPPVRVSGFPAGDISPSDVYDTTNNIIAELTRINLSLSLPIVPEADLSTEKKTPNDVVFQLQKIQLLLKNISSKS